MIQESTGSPTRGTESGDTFRHVALFYTGERAFVDAISAFVRDGVAAGEPTLVVVGKRKIELLRDALGTDADGVLFADMSQVGTNPGAIISAWDDFVAAHGAEGLRMRGVGEPITPGRSSAEVTECHRHEALLNLAFADAPGFWLVCPYDVDALDPGVVEAARATHPWVVERGAEAASPAYRADAMAATLLEEPLEEPPAGAYEVAFDRDSLTPMRDFVGEVAVDAGILGVRRDDLLLAVNELATNSVRHAVGEGVLRVWHDGYFLVCEVSDSGRIEHPLAGRLRPPPGALSGYGLWLVNQICDLVQVRVHDGGSVVRMRMRRG